MISGPNIRFRLITNDEDEFLFQCLKQWPADAQGPYTRERAKADIGHAMREHRHIEYPLQDERWTDEHGGIHGHRSDWFATVVIELRDEPIGAAKCRILGRSVWVSWLSLLPEHIGQGLFREIRLAWSWLTFEILQGDQLGFATPVDNDPTMAVMTMYHGKRSEYWKGPLDNDTEKAKWWHTRADYERDRETAFRDQEGAPITFLAC